MTQDASTVAALLGKSALFGPLEQADRLAVARQMHKVELEPHRTIFSRGDPGSHLYLVAEGRVRLSVFSADGRLLSFKHAGAGDVFGEIAALDGGPRSADAVALTRVVVMTLAAEPLNQLIERNPRVARAAIACLCQRLRETSAQAETIALHPVEMRLARYLLARVKPPAADAPRLRHGHGRPQHIPERAGLPDRRQSAEDQRRPRPAPGRRRHLAPGPRHGLRCPEARGDRLCGIGNFREKHRSWLRLCPVARCGPVARVSPG